MYSWNLESTVGYYKSPLGLIELRGTEDAIISLSFMDDGNDVLQSVPSACVQKGLRQLDEYFKGARRTFDLNLDPANTEFLTRAWDVALTIPFGKTVSYASLARLVGNPRACRAVAAAMAYNRIPIIIPCHRIIASDGSLGGYKGEVWRKKWLLAHERVHVVG